MRALERRQGHLEKAAGSPGERGNVLCARGEVDLGPAFCEVLGRVMLYSTRAEGGREGRA